MVNARIFFLPAYAAARVQTHVTRVAPTRGIMKEGRATDFLATDDANLSRLVLGTIQANFSQQY